MNLFNKTLLSKWKWRLRNEKVKIMKGNLITSKYLA